MSFFSKPQQQQQQNQMFLFTNDKTSASYSTNWADLHPSNRCCLLLRERMLEYRDESQRLDQSTRLYDSFVSIDGFEVDATHIVQELGGIGTAMDRQKTLLHELMSVGKDMLCNTEVAVRSFMMLRPRFLHHSGGASGATAPSQTPGATQGSSNQPTATSIVPVFDFYSGLPRKPSPFLQQTLLRFEKYIGECHQWIEELEQLLLLDSERNASSNGSSLLQSLPKVMKNVHDFFVNVAAKNTELISAARVAGLFSSSGTQGALPAPHTSAPPSSSSSGSGFSLFITPSAPSSSMSLFATPSTTSAPASSWFASSSAAAPSSLFGSASSVPGPASTPSLFSNTASLFGSTPASGSLFSGAVTGSGASFGPGSKNPRPKSRTARR
ncbi:hypothetical protein Lal_00027564 [Lupinus albus]|nr:hypothetical protein Lal_00027564 [Lupinus albus]